MNYERCRCQHCGYEYDMPRVEEFVARGMMLGTIDLAAWAYCTPGHLVLDGDLGMMSAKDSLRLLFRPLFRWMTRRRYERALRRHDNGVIE